MIFLNPTILFGLLAASIPIVLHFLNLRKIKKVEFSTLTFLKEIQKSKIRKIKIKQLLLLLLRILIILFLVASFARPTLESTSLGGVASKAKTTAIFILDNSFSMSVVNENGSYFNQAKEQIKKIFPSFESGDELYLILTSEINSNANLLESIKQIDAVDISNVTRPLTKSFEIAENIFKNSNNFNKEIFLFSDFQKSTFLEKDSSELSIGFSDVKLYLSNYGGKSIANSFLTNTYFNNQIFEMNREIGITAEVKTENKNGSEQLVSLFFNGKRVAQKNIQSHSSQSIFPNFQATIDNTGLIEVLTEIDEDAIEHDNKYYSHFIVPKNIELLIISKGKKQSGFIRAALSTSSNKTIKFKEISPSEFPNVNIEDYDALVIIGSDVVSYSKTLKSYVTTGGNILLFPSEDESFYELNRFSKMLNISPIKGIVQLNDKSAFNEFEKIDFEHPIFSGLFSKSEQEIESPLIYEYLKMGVSNNGRSIITLQDNSSFLSEYTIGKGKVLFFGIAPTLEWSNFPVKNIFAPLINRSVSYLNSRVNSNEKLYAGDIINVNISKRKSEQIKVVKPDESTEIINHSFEASNYLKYLNSSMIGNYKFYSNDELLDVKSVNVNPKESELKIIDFQNFVKHIENGKNSVVEISASDDYLKKIISSRYGSELWKLFLIIALFLALLEMNIARSAKKDFVELEN